MDVNENIIKKALLCEGWTSKEKLLLLSNLINISEDLGGDILEIGSAWGRSTVLLGLVSKRKIWSIDPHTGGRVYIERNKTLDTYEKFLSNLNSFNLLDKIVIFKNTTNEVIKKQLIPESKKFSLIFIDGMHTPSAVEIDFYFSLSHIMQKGYVVFDDYFGKKFIDYRDKIDELVSKYKINLVKDKISSLVYFQK